MSVQVWDELPSYRHGKSRNDTFFFARSLEMILDTWPSKNVLIKASGSKWQSQNGRQSMCVAWPKILITSSLNKNKKKSGILLWWQHKTRRESHRLQLETKPIHGSQYYKLLTSHPSVHPSIPCRSFQSPSLMQRLRPFTHTATWFVLGSKKRKK